MAHRNAMASNDDQPSHFGPRILDFATACHEESLMERTAIASRSITVPSGAGVARETRGTGEQSLHVDALVRLHSRPRGSADAHANPALLCLQEAAF